MTKQTPKLSYDWIDPHAYGIVKALQRAGHTTYLVGGCVRDLLIGIEPKDFDIATSARPEQVRKVIYRAYEIGRRFKLIHVRREDQLFEVATFRRDPSKAESVEEQELGDNLYGNPGEDAKRRDFTINGLFYDPVNADLIDHLGALDDLKSGWVRMIGSPDIRLAEDPIRILRGIRLSHMIGFQLEPELRASMGRFAEELAASPLPRRREEYLKLLRLKDPSLAFLEAHDLGLLEKISPTLDKIYQVPEHQEIFSTYISQMFERLVDKTDPIELMSHLILGFVRCHIQPDPDVPVKVSEWNNNEELQSLMRDELGIFKNETSIILKALHIAPMLNQVDEFARRGERRQMALLRNEAFPLAMKLARRDSLLSSKALAFWIERRSFFAERLAALVKKPRPKRRRRRKSFTDKTTKPAKEG